MAAEHDHVRRIHPPDRPPPSYRGGTSRTLLDSCRPLPRHQLPVWPPVVVGKASATAPLPTSRDPRSANIAGSSRLNRVSEYFNDGGADRGDTSNAAAWSGDSTAGKNGLQENAADLRALVDRLSLSEALVRAGTRRRAADGDPTPPVVPRCARYPRAATVPRRVQSAGRRARPPARAAPPAWCAAGRPPGRCSRCCTPRWFTSRNVFARGPLQRAAMLPASPHRSAPGRWWAACSAWRVRRLTAEAGHCRPRQPSQYRFGHLRPQRYTDWSVSAVSAGGSVSTLKRRRRAPQRKYQTAFVTDVSVPGHSALVVLPYGHRCPTWRWRASAGCGLSGTGQIWPELVSSWAKQRSAALALGRLVAMPGG